MTPTDKIENDPAQTYRYASDQTAESTKAKASEDMKETPKWKMLLEDLRGNRNMRQTGKPPCLNASVKLGS